MRTGQGFTSSRLRTLLILHGNCGKKRYPKRASEPVPKVRSYPDATYSFRESCLAAINLPPATLPGFSGESLRARYKPCEGSPKLASRTVSRSRRGFRVKYRFCRFYRFVFLVSYRVYNGASGSCPARLTKSFNNLHSGRAVSFRGDCVRIVPIRLFTDVASSFALGIFEGSQHTPCENSRTPMGYPTTNAACSCFGSSLSHARYYSSSRRPARALSSSRRVYAISCGPSAVPSESPARTPASGWPIRD